MNQQQRDVIDYLQEENQVLRQQLGTKRLRLSDEQRRRLAAKAKKRGRRILSEVATIVTPETLLAWHRKLIDQKYDGSKHRGPGRPRSMDEIRALNMYIHFDVLGVLALCITFGFAYRISSALFFLGFTYVFLLDQARYLNHFYLLCLVSLLMTFIPAHRSLSVDAWLVPDIRSSFVPAWSLWLLRFQIGIVYFYGGLAKLNGDWIQGWPLRLWFSNRSDLPLLGSSLADPVVAVFAAWAAIAIDLLAVPLMLRPRSRPFMFAALLTFHLLNAAIFSIGILPWLSIALTMLFFPPDWPQELLRRVDFGGTSHLPHAPLAARKSTAALLCLYSLLQLALPLRHWFYPGDVAWTEEGHRFSWRMKLRDKDGFVRFYLRDPSTSHRISYDWRRLLTDWQYREMVTRPDMITQFAKYLNDRIQREGRGPVEVTARALVSLNGRRADFLIDPDVNLARN